MMEKLRSPRLGFNYKSAEARKKKSYVLYITGAAVIITVLFILFGKNGYFTWRHRDGDQEFDDAGTFPVDFGHGGKKVANSTLDFSKIFAINLESRGDRRDEISMVTAAAGLDVEYVPGVPSSELDRKTLPDQYGSEHLELENSHLACFRSHANVWRTIVEQNLPSALILEDDIDFDLNIREIVPPLQRALANISHDPRAWHGGETWDMLYLGTCYELPLLASARANMSEISVDVVGAENDTLKNSYRWVEEIFQEYYGSREIKRVIVRSRNPVCTHGYAVSQHGARRLLVEFNNWLPFPIDLSMIHFITAGKFLAYSVLPPIITQWRNLDKTKVSDIDHKEYENQNWGHVHSARKSLMDWINHDELEFTKWWLERNDGT